MTTPTKSKVYWTDLRVQTGSNLLKKLEQLMLKAGFDTIDFKHKFTAIKLHFGEAGNLAYLRPNFSRQIVDMVREREGRPFLTDCNTLYPGRRKNALEHLDLAYEHGFTPLSTHAQIIIADGLDGTDEVLVPVPSDKAEYIKEARIGRAIMDADIIISLNHFKGHVEAGFGGAIKNIGMGCGSRGGKREMHAATEPQIKVDACISCKKCIRFCANDAISYVPGPKSKTQMVAKIDPVKCVGCGHCIAACPVDAIWSAFDAKSDIMDAKMVEYTLAVLGAGETAKPNFHINLVIDVSPFCDCWANNDVPIVSNIGYFASFDPVALDLACADTVNKAVPTATSMLGDKLIAEGLIDQSGEQADNSTPLPDYFQAIHGHSNWQAQINHAVKIGLGSDQYELIEVK